MDDMATSHDAHFTALEGEMFDITRLVRDLIQRLPFGPYAAPSSIVQTLMEDYSTKGEMCETRKRVRSYAEAEMRRKRKAIVVSEETQDFDAYVNLDSHVEAPEEGEIVREICASIRMDPIEKCLDLFA